ncbi:MAG: DUF1844 domain-containing protein [Planctomycetes bacterium]|nr:DUF1844 domain-containing protein [Planctomycetota bacterium]MCG2682812.1 DUF1844 domain-containing protein [Planctomycetales bacterium]
MVEEPKNPEKKLIIDEDWKSRVEAEKEAARRAEESSTPAESEAPADRRGPLPPADLTFLVGTMYMQGAIALGLLPNPVTSKQEVQPEQAQHMIDLLTMLQQKTEGNRTAEETEGLETVLHELRLAYVTLQGK